MFEQYYTKHLSLEEISDILEVTKSTVQIHMEKHDYVPRNPNDYDKIFVKQSKAETEIVEFIKTLGIDNIQTGNTTILGDRELDIYLPDYKIAIEYNGLFYHNDTQKEPKYHLQKTLDCQKQRIFLLHVFEDEWKYKQPIVKSIFMAKLGKSKRIYARKTTIKIIDTQTKDVFLTENHLQGTDRSKVKLGLYKDDILYAVMTFCKPRFCKKSDWELSRYACKENWTVVGGFSKLFKHAMIKCDVTGTIVSYSDKRWSQGNVYATNGFVNTKVNPQTYSYFDPKKGIRLNRMFLQKKYFPDLKDTHTETDIANLKGYSRIYDCGTLTWHINTQ
jgi:predicted DNA-binding protein YlxM (UPF0122 family)